jgi:hypothetical protein
MTKQSHSSSSRRTFLRQGGLATLSLGSASVTTIPQPSSSYLASCSCDGNIVKLFTTRVKAPIKVLLASDTHLWMDDDRGIPYRTYSARMAKAYNQTKHFQTKEATTPEASFQQIIDLAKSQKVDLVSLPGDLFSFPSEAAIDWVMQQLKTLEQPFQYTAGNHDWHYEGMEGKLADLRREWCEKRLKPLYQGQSYLMSAMDIKGVRFLSFDNSTNEILPEQLTFLRQQIASKVPLIVFAHIPFYVPGRSMGFGCGHPDWGWNSDRNFEIERRERWPKTGHSSTTLAFCRELFSANSLLGVFAGHTHRPSMDSFKGIPQIVAEANATGAYLDIQIMPL